MLLISPKYRPNLSTLSLPTSSTRARGGGEWRRILVNFEALWADEASPTSNLSFVVARHPDRLLENASFRFSNKSKALFATLAETDV
jgi:hypothetical protein